MAVDEQGMSKQKQKFLFREKKCKFNMPHDGPCTIPSLYKPEASHTMFALALSASALLRLKIDLIHT